MNNKTEWWKLAAVAATAIVLAGLGSVIASNFSPPAADAGAMAAAADTTTTMVTPPTTAQAFEAAVAITPTTAGAPTAPAVLETSDTIVEFGEDGTTIDFDVTNTGGTASAWVVQSSDPSFTTSPADGEVAAGESETITVNVDRTTLAEGEFDSILTLLWEDQELQIFVQGVQFDNPIIIGPRATPPTVFAQTLSTCSPAKTIITVRVKDTSELAEVLVRWTSDGDGVTTETPMSATGEETFEAEVGPFASTTASVKVVAKDIYDNAGGAAVPLTVAVCP